MSVGLGVFLGSLFLGTIILYLKTRGEWNWRTIWKRIGLTVFSLVAVLVIAIAATVGHGKWQERPQVVTSLEGVVLGEKLSDAVFRYGEFKEKTPEDRQKGGSDGDKRYHNDEKRIMVDVRDGRIESIIYSCNSASDYTTTGGITCGRSGEEIFSRFGGDVRVQCPTKMDDATDKLIRVYDVPNFGVRYFLHKDTVIAFFVMDKKSLINATGINWRPCS